MATTRELVRDFQLAFERPVNESLTDLSPEDRILLAKLLLEEVVEYAVKGLGLVVDIYSQPDKTVDYNYLNVTIPVGRDGPGDPGVDPVECTDGLADVNVVIHFNAHWQGINLDRATEIVHDSNMSKLDVDGKPIINGVTPGARKWSEATESSYNEPLYDPNKPIGKILKGPNFYEPKEKLLALIQEERNNRG